MKRPIIASLWIGGKLSYLEVLSLRSMIDWGHEVKLYHYRPIENAPEWLSLYDANAIMPMSEERLESFGTSMSIVANLFRYHLLAKTDEIWCDCDVYFMRPLPDQPYLFVLEQKSPPQWNNSLLRLPQDSPVLLDLLEFLSTDTPTLPDSEYFFDGRKSTKQMLVDQGGNGNVHLTNLPWGTSGPRALSYFIVKNGIEKYQWPRYMHMPINEKAMGVLARTKTSINQQIPINTQSIHFYGSTMRGRIIAAGVFKNNEPMPGSFLAERMKDHGIDPKKWPLQVAYGKKEHLDAQAARGGE